MTLDEELQLVEKAKENAQAFGTLYDYYFSKIFTYTLNRLPQKEVAEDITCEVFKKAVEKIHTFDTSRRIRFGSWLYRTTHNAIIDFVRTNKQSVSDEIFESIRSDRSAEELVEKEENQKAVALVLSKINKRYQEVLSLSFFLELDDHEIAETMNTKKSNVHVLMHRALKQFRKEFEKHFGKT